MPTLSKQRLWLRDLFSYARDSWREIKAEEARLKEEEYNRLHPVYGPKTQMQEYLEEVWSKEIMQQLLPVLRFEQFAAKDANVNAE
jgi:hypothetical protein